MKKVFLIRRVLSGALIFALVAGSLSGCQYSSFDEYLKALGIRDPYEYEDIWEEATIEASPEILEQITTKEQQHASSEVASFDVTDSVEKEALTPDEETVPVEENTTEADFAFKDAYRSIDEQALDKEVLKARTDIGLTDEGIASLKNTQKGNFAYEKLTESGKTLYVEMLTIMENLASDVTVSTTSSDAIELVFDYIMADHPEIFYVNGFKYTNYSMDNVVTRVSFTGDYTYDAQEVARRKTRINEAVNKCLENAPSSEDDYYAIKYVYEYIIDNVEYDVNAQDNQNICSVFLGGRSVCNGYAKAAQYLLEKLGIKCSFVTGTVTTKNGHSERHAWNLVLCNDAYYYMDVTWGDASYQTLSGESADSSKLPTVNYDYLNVTTQELERHHKISDLISMPVCNSMTDNYYVREDEYFTSPELTLVGDLFDRRYKDGSGNVTIKCATSEVYQALFDDLITDRKVFDYLQGDNSQVSYTTFEDTRTIMFWL